MIASPQSSAQPGLETCSLADHAGTVWDHVVVGSGISGLSSARLLRERGESVLLLEKESGSGGLVRCTREAGGVLYHRVGGHVFNTRIPAVAEWFWSQFDQQSEFLHAVRQAMISYEFDRQHSYPIESHLYEYGEEFCARAIADMMEAQLGGDGIDTSSFGSYLRTVFGATLYEAYFRPYNEKIWRRDLQEIGVDWLEGKLPQPKAIEAIMANIFRQENDTMAHATFYYPVVNGSQFLVDRLSRDLTIAHNTPVQSIEVDGLGIVINGVLRCRSLVYTGDLRVLPAHLTGVSFPERLRQAVENLLSNSTSSTLCRAGKLPYSWLYVPNGEFNFHRIIHTGGFAPSNNGQLDPSTSSSCVVEFSGEFSPEQMREEIARAGIGLEPIAHNYAANSYVVHRPDTAGVVEEARRLLAGHRIHLLGRFAEWQYYNMDNAIDAAMRLVAQLPPAVA
jgi:protoporphyrinogen oxidase